jgi:hypothetical protein
MDVYHAVASGNLAVLQHAIDTGHSVNGAPKRMFGGYVNTPLEKLIDMIFQVYLRVERANVTWHPVTDLTGLEVVKFDLYFAMLDMLLRNGANTELPNIMTNTPLLALAKTCKPPQIPRKLQMINRLIIAGANVSAVDYAGCSALHTAAQNDQCQLALMLLHNGANVNAVTDVGATPLHRAAYFGHINTAAMLVENGADVFATNTSGLTPAASARLTFDQMGSREPDRLDRWRHDVGLWNDFGCQSELTRLVLDTHNVARYLDDVEVAQRIKMLDFIAMGYAKQEAGVRLIPGERELMELILGFVPTSKFRR